MANDKDTRIEGLRALPVPKVLEILGLYAKVDSSYQPKDPKAQRLHVSLESGEVLEIHVLGEKWYDTRAMKGGGGAIDFVMHLYEEAFPQAVQRLLGLLEPKGKMQGLLPSPRKAPKAVKVPRKTGRKQGEDKEEKDKSRHLVPIRKEQEEYYVANLLDWIPKDDIASMEHPLFALKAGDKRLRVYERNGVSLKVAPGFLGHATIHDKDLWIYCVSLLVAAKNRDEPISRTVRFRMVDFMRATNRDTSGRAYQRASEMLDRLKGTTITTNVVTPNYKRKAWFGLIDSAQVIEKDRDNRMVAVEVTLPDWLICSIDARQVLTLSRDYFRLRKPIDRRIYEIARKYCGQQKEWKVSMTVLHEKSGSSAGIREFRRQVKDLVDSDELPDYQVTYDKEKDMVIFSVRSPADK